MVVALKHNNREDIKKEMAMKTNLEHFTITNLISSKIKALLPQLKIFVSFLHDPPNWMVEKASFPSIVRHCKRLTRCK